MNFLTNISIKYKIIATILSITLLILGIGFTVGMAYYSRNIHNEMIAYIRVNTKLIGEYCIAPIVFQDQSGAKRVLSKLETLPNVIAGIVYDDQNKTFASYNPRKLLLPPPSGSKPETYQINNNQLHVIQPIVYDNRQYGYIHVVASMSAIQQNIRKAYQFTGIMVFLLMGLSYLLALKLQRIISEPILKLAKVTEQISAEADFSMRVKKKGSDELGILYDGFNTMMEQLHLREKERDRTAEEIRASLHEKEVMLREIHHRVKNNLQVISSLLSLQSNYIQDEDAMAMFVDCQNRVRSMAMVHERLYQTPDITHINISEYTESLVNALMSSHQVEKNSVTLNLDIDKEIHLSIEQAVPCGLVIHEIISNALKHAFRDHEDAKIDISLYQLSKEKYHLHISDNGIGIPVDIDFGNSKSLGLRLISILVENQLKGTLDLDRTTGTSFQIKF